MKIFVQKKIHALRLLVGLMVGVPLLAQAPCPETKQIAKDQYFKLMLVTNKKDKPLNEYLDFIKSCAKSGITSVQLREKNLSYDELREFGKQLKAVLDPLGIPLIVNDHVKLAHELGAASVHLGQTDGDVREARALLGDDKIIGLSVDSIEQLSIAHMLPIDYIGVGAIFPSKTKRDVAVVLGCDGLKQIALASKYPVIAIGGITALNAGEVIQAGAHGIAAIGAFHDGKDPISSTKNLRSMIDGVCKKPKEIIDNQC